ncbi:uncharacterized protein LOC119093872 [Pollicipes pollicipes]|uniref:uncharacterized protein LOC119093872 n=1 Tax=Pollicipes pollicipes TaxID=41117 RepID=UPI001884A58C|nr:uncharacterized protein LOC119093872 [Pollicipes pollicipes]
MLEGLRTAVDSSPKCLLAAFLTATLAVARHHGNAAETSAAANRLGDNCSAVFEEGSAWVKWRENGPAIQPDQGAPYCVIQHFDKDRTHECLERRFQRALQRYKAIFIGDSRARNLFAFVSPRIGADREIRRGKDNCLERFNRTYEPGETPHGRDHWCSYKQEGDFVTSTYLSRNQMDDKYMDSVRQLLRSCQLASCPDLLLANGGMHTVWRFYHDSAVRGLQLFGRQMEQLAPLLDQLAQLGVTVVWALNEPMMEDAGGGFVRMHPEIVWLMNQVAVSILRRYPGVRIWSSHLPVAIWYHEMCRALGHPNEWGFLCHDQIHVGDYALENYKDILLNSMCDGMVAMPDSNCCGMRF